MRRFRLSVGFSLLVALMVYAAQSCYGQAQPATPEVMTDGSKAVADVPATFKIGVGDVLHISVWEEPQFTETAVVRPDGAISIPLVADVMVAGLTPEIAGKTLTERLE